MYTMITDGGRAAAGFRGEAGDCACRAISIACQMPYREAYDLINRYCKRSRPRRIKTSARTGVLVTTMKQIMSDLGWQWRAATWIGQSGVDKLHLTDGALPTGRFICRLSKHYVAVIDNVIYDMSDPSRDSTRLIYGYWSE